MSRILLANSSAAVHATHIQTITGKLGMHAKREAASVAMRCSLEPVPGGGIQPG